MTGDTLVCMGSRGHCRAKGMTKYAIINRRQTKIQHQVRVWIEEKNGVLELNRWLAFYRFVLIYIILIFQKMQSEI